MSQEKGDQKPLSPAGKKRRKAIMEAAMSLFTEKGYAAVTMDEIISVAGGSKSSPYKFFGNKEGILKAVVESLADDMLQEIDIPFSTYQTPREALNHIGFRLGKLILSANAINQYRLAISNSVVLPDAARMWYESGPRTTFEGFAEYLKRENAAGRLQVGNPTRAALFFLGMIAFKDNITMSIGADPPPDSELRDIVKEAVDVFLAGFGR
ncbi:MAG: TetR family transcriptional regulator [Deltaproteobacteria bacterium]|nr:TetR family transcriptional regulator [Deltaproteobacteria bacterium]NIS77730.1 TetR family transcriptional regulator [Deltaproteobacteria bacterium]